MQKFWGRFAEMITGPEHEYVYLRRIIRNFGIKMDQKAAEAAAVHRRKALGTKLKHGLLQSVGLARGATEDVGSLKPV